MVPVDTNLPADTLLASLHFQVPCNSDYFFLKKSILIKKRSETVTCYKERPQFPAPTFF